MELNEVSRSVSIFACRFRFSDVYHKNQMIANLSSIIFASWRILPECFMMQNESSQPPRRRKTRPPVASPALAHPVRHSSTLIKGSPVEIPVGIWHGREKNLQRIQQEPPLLKEAGGFVAPLEASRRDR